MIKKFQQVLMLSIEGKELNLRKEIVGWSWEFGNEDYQIYSANPLCYVGFLHSGRKFSPPVTVAHALRDGWKLLSHGQYTETVIPEGVEVQLPMIQIIMVREVDCDGVPI